MIGFASADTQLGYGEVIVEDIYVPNYDRVYLSLDARIDYPKLAGAAEMLQVKVNGVPVTKTQLVNKGPIFTFPDGKKYAYYTDETGTWKLFYSPSFTSSGIREGDAYKYVFDITSLVYKENTNEIIIANAGPVIINKIPPKNVNLVKSLTLVTRSIAITDSFPQTTSQSNPSSQGSAALSGYASNPSPSIPESNLGLYGFIGLLVFCGLIALFSRSSGGGHSGGGYSRRYDDDDDHDYDYSRPQVVHHVYHERPQYQPVYEPCPECGGSGRVEEPVITCGIAGAPITRSKRCSYCNGTGKIRVN